ncbi:hypothetical protein GCM10017778_39800 [Streptomyces vinaceus]|nr:hypothetical protein GCM10017778_39800 [Streptomyces vinaceus]
MGVLGGLTRTIVALGTDNPDSDPRGDPGTSPAADALAYSGRSDGKLCIAIEGTTCPWVTRPQPRPAPAA